MDSNMIMWLALAAIFLIVEVATVNLVSVWFVAGALAAFVASLFGAGIGVQIGVFVLVTAVLLIFTMPAARRLLKDSRQATNSDRIIGHDAIVTEDIDNIKGTGQIKVMGSVWSAKSEDDNKTIPSGSKVIVNEIRGVKAVVKVLDKE